MTETPLYDLKILKNAVTIIKCSLSYKFSKTQLR
nr:MAG TPA: hypothetical protein [Caudoviricetes sp.]